MDASWGLQLQLQAWPVPNRRIQPQHDELDSLSISSTFLSRSPEKGLLARVCTSQASTSDGSGRRRHQRQGSAGAQGGPSAQLGQPTRLENIHTLDPHSHAALTDLSSWLGPTHEIHEPALLTAAGGVDTKGRVRLEPKVGQALR